MKNELVKVIRDNTEIFSSSQHFFCIYAEFIKIIINLCCIFGLEIFKHIWQLKLLKIYVIINM